MMQHTNDKQKRSRRGVTCAVAGDCMINKAFHCNLLLRKLHMQFKDFVRLNLIRLCLDLCYFVHLNTHCISQIMHQMKTKEDRRNPRPTNFRDTDNTDNQQPSTSQNPNDQPPRDRQTRFEFQFVAALYHLHIHFDSQAWWGLITHQAFS